IAAPLSGAAAVLAEGAIRAMTITKWRATMIIPIMLYGVSTALSSGGKATLAGEKSDQERIVGIWRLASGIGSGKDAPIEAATLARITFSKDRKLISSMVDQTGEGTYKLVGPGQIDVTFQLRDKEPSLAIYKFEGDDRLTICLGREPRRRPTEFTATKESGQ